MTTGDFVTVNGSFDCYKVVEHGIRKVLLQCDNGRLHGWEPKRKCAMVAREVIAKRVRGLRRKLDFYGDGR